MKRTKLTESQIIALLKEGEAGVPVEELCRKYSIGNSTYYKLRSKYAGMEVSALKGLKELESENRRLKQMYADLSLEHQIIKEVGKKVSRLLVRGRLARNLIECYGISIAMACRISHLSRSMYYHKPHLAR